MNKGDIMKSNHSDLITIFYDGKCNLCAKEINYYRNITPAKIFNWQDITQNNKQLATYGISLADSLKLLHATDRSGKLHVGVAAFILIWQELPKWRYLAKFVKLPLVRQCVDAAYKIFAAWRFKKLAHCQLALQEKKLPD